MKSFLDPPCIKVVGSMLFDAFDRLVIFDARGVNVSGLKTMIRRRDHHGRTTFSADYRGEFKLTSDRSRPRTVRDCLRHRQNKY